MARGHRFELFSFLAQNQAAGPTSKAPNKMVSRESAALSTAL